MRVGTSIKIPAFTYRTTVIRFFTGTFLVEGILKYLGRRKISPSTKNATLSFLNVSRYNSPTLFHSTSRARYLALVIASTMHTSYFIMMGSRGGFPVMFIGYVVAAFARALLTGKLATILDAEPRLIGVLFLAPL